ncbi:MAG: bifunctional folylpolyglutamate synthase/dihydrofolate synthase, partial [Rhizobiaceae bacterium]
MSSVRLSSAPSVQKRIDALMESHPRGYDLSLDRISGLLDKLGDPQDGLPPVIHVAGTNGKGSTIAFMRSVLEAAGLSVHVHTSPHLVRWNERYRIAGKLVGDEEFCAAIDRVAQANDGQLITVFEILTA